MFSNYPQTDRVNLGKARSFEELFNNNNHIQILRNSNSNSDSYLPFFYAEIQEKLDSKVHYFVCRMGKMPQAKKKANKQHYTNYHFYPYNQSTFLTNQGGQSYVFSSSEKIKFQMPVKKPSVFSTNTEQAIVKTQPALRIIKFIKKDQSLSPLKQKQENDKEFALLQQVDTTARRCYTHMPAIGKDIANETMAIIQDHHGMPLDHPDIAGLPLGKKQEIFQLALMDMHRVHRQGMVHRDLKPGNVLVKLDEMGNITKVTIIDFGFAKKESESARYNNGIVVGDLDCTPVYACPQSFNTTLLPQNPRSYSSDIYSLGLVFTEFLHDCENRTNSNYRAHFQDDILIINLSHSVHRPLESKFFNEKRIAPNKQLSQPLKKLLFQMTEFEPDQRPTAEAILKRDNLFANTHASEELVSKIKAVNAVIENYERQGKNYTTNLFRLTKRKDNIAKIEALMKNPSSPADMKTAIDAIEKYVMDRTQFECGLFGRSSLRDKVLTAIGSKFAPKENTLADQLARLRTLR